MFLKLKNLQFDSDRRILYLRSFDYVRNLGREPAIAGFEAKPVAVLVAIADIESVFLSQNQKFHKIIETSRQQ
ncbi:hypothetical protein NDA07_24580 [Microcoleus vaginatus DQ-U2]|uniref:hypothetical protein n=1 Tax=Microcoleus vaginatus TaxID=119532 RepID=UPI001682A930|nr:hypothetical protein [Microcoleus sp. FACHB-DQ6]